MTVDVHILTMFCANCGTELPADARFCVLCGAPAGALGGARVLEQAETTVQVRMWRGFVKAEFYVEIPDPDTGELRVERSRSFTWRHDRPPPDDREDVHEAYAALVARLTELGWEQVGVRSPWYAQRFRLRDDGGLQAFDSDGAPPGRLRDVSQEGP